MSVVTSVVAFVVSVVAKRVVATLVKPSKEAQETVTAQFRLKGAWVARLRRWQVQ